MEGLELHCFYPQCPGQLAQSLEHFLAMIEFKGIGPKICEQLVKSDLVRKWADLWRLEPGQFEDYLGWSQEHAVSVVTELAEIKKDVPFEKLLRAFQIRHLGRSVSKKIAQKWPDIKSLLAEEWPEAWFDSLGPTTGPEICEGLGLACRSSWVSLKLAGFTIKAPSTPRAEGTVKIVITGTLTKGRREYEALIEGAGHELQRSLGKDTDILVTGDNVGAGKTAKAERYGTAIKSEDWLISLLE